jgi:hypothetical protein
MTEAVNTPKRLSIYASLHGTSPKTTIFLLLYSFLPSGKNQTEKPCKIHNSITMTSVLKINEASCYQSITVRAQEFEIFDQIVRVLFKKKT